MARKTMAERYASQRSNKTARRRALPRLSDAAALSNAGAASSAAPDLYDVHEVHLSRTAEAGATTFTAGTAPAASPAPSPRGRAMPRRAGGASGGAGTLVAAGVGGRVNYAYVRRDLRNIATIAVGMLVLLVVLNLILQAIIH